MRVSGRAALAQLVLMFLVGFGAIAFALLTYPH